MELRPADVGGCRNWRTAPMTSAPSLHRASASSMTRVAQLGGAAMATRLGEIHRGHWRRTRPRRYGCWQHPLLERVLPRTAWPLPEPHGHAEWLLDRYNCLPRTVAHQDTQDPAVRAGELSRQCEHRGHRLELPGSAPVGHDLGSHVAGNIYNRVIDPFASAEHDGSATEAYLRGLYDLDGPGTSATWSSSAQPRPPSKSARSTIASVVALPRQGRSLRRGRRAALAGGVGRRPHRRRRRRCRDGRAGFDYLLDLGG